MSKIRRVYVAGLLTPVGTNSKHPAIDFLVNVRNLIRASLDVLFAGFTPFCPGLDHHYWFELRNGEYITEAMIKRISKDFLEVCEAVLLTPGWRKSKGTLAEIKLAEEKGIPVFHNLDKLVEYSEEGDDDKN